MASGIPPVCVRAGGAYGIINEGVTGLIAEPHNAESFAGKILYFLDNEVKRHNIGLNALKYSHTQSWDTIISRLLQSYTGIIDNYKKTLIYKTIKAA